MDSSVKRSKPNMRGWFVSRSFRARLRWSVVILVVYSVASTTIYTLYRTSLTNTFLSNQISDSVKSQAEKELTSIASRHARDLDVFFSSFSNNMETLGASIQLLLPSSPDATTNSNWETDLQLTRLPQGSWDNPNTEAGSIFAPAQDQLPDALLSELIALKRVDVLAPFILQNNPDMIALYFGSLEGETLYYPNIDLSAILPPDFDVTLRPWFIAAAPNQNPSRDVVWSVPYQDAALHGLVVTTSLPVHDDKNRFRGVIAADIQLQKISDLVASIGYGQTGYAFLLDQEGRIIAMPESGYIDLGLSMTDFQGDTALDPILGKVPLDVFDLLSKMTTNQSGVRQVILNGEEKYVAYQPIPAIGYSMGIVVPVSETQAVLITTREQLSDESRSTLINIIAATLLLLAVSLVISRWMGNTFARPLLQLTEIATRLSEGDLSTEANLQSRDEIGVLAEAFNTMTSRLRDLITNLEKRVTERTADLEKTTIQSKKRADELQTISDISRAISDEQELEKLLPHITRVVSERFGFYHVGIFLLDETSTFAVLRATNSQGGQRMLERGHRLEIGQVGIVGKVAAAGVPRLALDVGEDSVFFKNPDLPETRSEIALPLKISGKIIGVLDVQSTEPSAFTNEDVNTLSILADQIAIAIEKARLLETARKSLDQTEAAYGQYIRNEWMQFTREEKLMGFQYANGISTPLEKPLNLGEIFPIVNTGNIYQAEARYKRGTRPAGNTSEITR